MSVSPGASNQRAPVAIVGAGPGGLAAALEAVERGVRAESITVVESRPAATLQRNIVVDRFMIERLARFHALPPSLNPWTALAVTIGSAELATPILVPTVDQIRPGGNHPPPSVHLAVRRPAGVAHLADLSRTMRRVAHERGIRVLTATPVVDLCPRSGGGWELQIEDGDGTKALQAERVVLACGAGSPLLAKLGVEREWVPMPNQPWMMAFFEGPSRHAAAMRVLDRQTDGIETCYYISSTEMTSITLGLRPGAAPEQAELDDLARRAAHFLGVRGGLLEAFVFDTRNDRATRASLERDCILLGDALRRSDVTYGGGANAAFTDAWWAGEWLVDRIGLEAYAVEVGRNTDGLIGGSWSMRVFDGLLAVSQSGRRLWPEPMRRLGDLSASLMTQGLAAAITAWGRVLNPPRPNGGTAPRRDLDS